MENPNFPLLLSEDGKKLIRVVDKSITSIDIPEGVRKIEDKAFESCERLKSITIPDSVSEIGWHAFKKCIELERVVMSNNITEIEYGVFYECSKLVSINIPENVTRIGPFAFWACTSLTAIIIPHSVKSIGECAFYRNESLREIQIPHSLTSIFGSAFYGCNYLPTKNHIRYADTFLVELVDKQVISVTIDEKTRVIGAESFRGCSQLTTVFIPKNVENIGYGAFWECESLHSIIVDENNPHLSSQDGVLFNKDKTSIVCYPQGKIDIQYSIPNGVKSIKYGAFYGCSRLESISIPKSLSKIHQHAFCQCSSLANINVPDSTIYIGTNAFKGCLRLNTVNIHSDKILMSLYYYELPNILGDVEVHFIGNVTDITGEEKDLKELGRKIINYVLEKDSNQDINYLKNVFEDRMLYDLYYIHKNPFSLSNIFGNHVRKFIIGEEVTKIGKQKFANCTSMTTIEIPDSVEYIEYDAFDGCDHLPVVDNIRYADTFLIKSVDINVVSVTIKKSTRFIGKEAFKGCYSLTTIKDFNTNIKSIGDGAFSDTFIHKITIPNSVTKIGKYSHEIKDGTNIGITPVSA